MGWKPDLDIALAGGADFQRRSRWPANGDPQRKWCPLGKFPPPEEPIREITGSYPLSVAFTAGQHFH